MRQGLIRYQSFFFLCLILMGFSGSAQLYDRLTWSGDGNSFYVIDEGAINEYNLTDRSRHMLVSPEKLIPAGKKESLEIVNFFFSADFSKILIYTNAKKVWRHKTRGDYWIYKLSDSSLKQLGKSLPASSLMFAKFSPD